MKKNEHIARHEFLHRALDELCADFMASHPFDRLSEDVRSANLLSNTTVMDLLSWSSRQTKSPSVIYDRKEFKIGDKVRVKKPIHVGYMTT